MSALQIDWSFSSLMNLSGGGISWALYAGVFLASALGSLHCVSMCGGIALSVAGGSKRPGGAVFLYHLARGFAYVGLGVLWGAIGKVLYGGMSVAVLKIAALLAVAVSVVYSGWLIWSGRQHEVLGSRWLSRVSTSVFRRARGKGMGRSGSAVLTGVATALLPCGWLYSFAAVAAASGSAIQGGAILSAFFLGTVPALLVGAAGLRAVLRLEKLALRRAIAVLVVALGGMNLVAHARGLSPMVGGGGSVGEAGKAAHSHSMGGERAGAGASESEEASCH